MKETREHCEYYKSEQCFSCQYLNLSYEEAITQKLKSLNELSSAIEEPVLNAIGFSTRNKAKFVVSGSINNPILGIPDGKVEIVNCPLHENELNILAAKIKPLITLMNIAPYNIALRKGELKYLIIFQAPETKEIMIRFVLRSKESIDRIKKNLTSILALSKSIKVVSVNIQSEHKAILEGDEEVVLSEAQDLEAIVNENSLWIKPQSFFQTNSYMMNRLYFIAKEWTAELKIKNAIDLYCGVGGFTFSLAPQVEKITGVEMSAKAIDSANKSLAQNNLPNTTFLNSDVENSLELLTDRIDLLVVNPPRRGLDKKLINKIILSSPEYLLYSSCNPTTLKLDLESLLIKYEIVRMKPFDMFAYSSHWEILTLLKRI
jgi:23S rRNA (uracil747-C5)-methyltransferase